MAEAASTSSGAGAVLAWVRQNPIAAFLIAVIGLTLIYFFGFVKIFREWTHLDRHVGLAGMDPGNELRARQAHSVHYGVSNLVCA